MNNKLAHISDIHIRFGSRHEEFKNVFARVIADLEKIRPRRIILTGDLFHLKINLSPVALELAHKFISKLSEIAPVDIILGNHDLNEQDLNQGNAIKPMIEMIHNGYILSSEDKVLPIPESGNGIYFYHDSGFYNVDTDLVYGVYSIWDNEILTLDKPEPGKKHIALYHGPVYGCMSDNGFELKSDEYLKISTFNNFDMVMLGDIHEHQVFERDGKHTAAYAGSLIQQDIGESLDKGYLIWDLNTCEFERKFIPNDFGFSKLTVTKGEIWQDRLEDLKFSFNPKKTKVFIEIEDDRENESVELKSHIRKYIKQKWGCENVEVEFKKILRDKILGTGSADIDINEKAVWQQLLLEFLKENGFDNVDDVIQFDNEVSSELNYFPPKLNHLEWDLKEMVTCNVFSHPATETYFDFEKIGGIVGIFGKNYSGKSNIIKALIWGLFEKVLGGGVSDNHKVLNMYTGKNKAYVYLVLSIAGGEYKIKRTIEVDKKRDGTTKGTYSIEFFYKQIDDQGNEKWVAVESDKAAKEKSEVKKLVLDAIGTFDNFTKISLQTQGGKDDYLSLAQQDKNDLVKEYMDLKVCDLKHELVNKKFNQVKTLQKNLGDPAELEASIEKTQITIKEVLAEIEFFNIEKQNAIVEIDKHNEEILELTKKLHKIEVPNESIETLQASLHNMGNEIKSINSVNEKHETWLNQNGLKDISSEISGLDVKASERKIDELRNQFKNNKADYVKLDNWINFTVVEPVKPIDDSEKKIDELKEKLLECRNNLKLAKGEKCPTCGHVKHEYNAELEAKLTDQIKNIEKEITENQNFIFHQKENEKLKQKVISEKNRLDSLKNILQSTKLDIDQLKFKLEQYEKIADDIKHNAKIKETQNELNINKSIQEKTEKLYQEVSKKIELIKENSTKIAENQKINDTIKTLQESIKGYKITNYNFDERIKNSHAQVMVQENNLENYKDKLSQIKESVRIFNKYSIYLQAVSRDGIPSQIIRKKLPLVNYKINSILRNIVNFKIEMFVTPKGDIQERFYFNEDKSDALPLSLGSGSQKFIGSVAIRDGLHYISCLVKPSFCIIDEGFGTLDDEKTGDINNIFSYLKTKYRMVLVITHRNEIKDYVDHIITVSKTSVGLPDSVLSSNPEAGISQFSFT